MARDKIDTAFGFGPPLVAFIDTFFHIFASKRTDTFARGRKFLIRAKFFAVSRQRVTRLNLIALQKSEIVKILHTARCTSRYV